MARVALENSSALAWPDAMRHPSSYAPMLRRAAANRRRLKRQVEDSAANRVCAYHEKRGTETFERTIQRKAQSGAEPNLYERRRQGRDKSGGRTASPEGRSAH